MCQDGVGREDVYNVVEGVSAGGGPLERCVFLEQVRKWFDYMGETWDECSMVVQESQRTVNFSYCSECSWPRF